MLQAVLADLRAWGAVQTVTTQDPRLSGAFLPADEIVPLQPDQHQRRLLELASRCTAALIIAPESEGALGQVSQWLESAAVPLLGSSAAAVSVAADKWQCYQLFQKNAIPTPESWLVRRHEALATAARRGLPLVVKPRWGAGAEGVSLVTEMKAWPQAYAGSPEDEFLLQSYVPGTHASVSLISDGRDSLPLSLNEQQLRVGIPFAYRGGRIPLDQPLREQALDLAQRAVALIPGLCGYVGVDLVLSPEECSVIEINPRLTTSYVGLRHVIDLNLAEAIWGACRDGHLPPKPDLKGSITFDQDGTIHA